MTWLVRWTPVAENRLAAAWLASADRNAITAAVYEIDNLLELFPSTTGDISFDTVRVFEEPPLSVEFEINEAARSVTVLNVWLTADGRPEPTGN